MSSSISSSITCPVCGVAFIYREEAEPGAVLICPVCGAKIEALATAPEFLVHKLPQEPETEIVERIDNFARLRGYVFNEDRDLYVKGLLTKKERYGDFYCPCRYNNDPENICPCLDARSNRVRKEGRCLCGLFNLPAQEDGGRR
jgi:ferredoxin-thioredoxin reductase catalytic subunit